MMCVLHECPQPKPRISFFHNVLPLLSPPLSHSPLSDNVLCSKTYLNAFPFIFRGKEDKTVMSVYPRWKAFPVYSCIYLAHRRLLCLSFVFFFSRMFCLPPGNLTDSGSRRVGALKVELESLGSNQGSCFIHCWKDVACIYNCSVQQWSPPCSHQ